MCNIKRMGMMSQVGIDADVSLLISRLVNPDYLLSAKKSLLKAVTVPMLHTEKLSAFFRG